MNSAELQRIKDFYEKGTPRERVEVRALFAVRYGKSNGDVFEAEGYEDAFDFAGTTEDMHAIPESVWSLLEHDHAIETFEGFAAYDILDAYEYVLEKQKNHKAVTPGIEASKRLSPEEKDWFSHVFRDAEVEPVEDVVDRLVEKLSVLNKDKVLEEARILITLKERELFRPEPGVRGRA